MESIVKVVIAAIIGAVTYWLLSKIMMIALILTCVVLSFFIAGFLIEEVSFGRLFGSRNTKTYEYKGE